MESLQNSNFERFFVIEIITTLTNKKKGKE